MKREREKNEHKMKEDGKMIAEMSSWYKIAMIFRLLVVAPE